MNRKNLLRLLALLASATLAGCSASTYERTDCSENTECQAAFGLGTACGNDGFCEVVELPPRCETVYPEDLELPIDPESTFLVGSVFDHSLDTHVGRYRSAQLAATQVNGEDGLNGRDFAMIHCTNTENPDFDDLSKTDASESVAVWLADTVGVPAIVGPAASSRTQVVYNAVANEFNTLVISPSATSPSLTPLDGLLSTDADPGLLWRTAPPDDLQGLAIAQDMLYSFDPHGVEVYRTAPSTHVGVIYQSGAYGEGLQASFINAFSGHNTTYETFTFDNDGTRSVAIANAANGGFDEILFVSSDTADNIAFLQGAAALSSLADTPLFLPDAGRNGDVLESSAAAASTLFPHIRGTAPATPAGGVYEAFQLSYLSEYASDVSSLSFTAQSFDAMWLLIYGHVWALNQTDGEINGTNIARGLRRLSHGEPIKIQAREWTAAKAHLEAGESIDVLGASGSLDYAPNGETTATIDIWVVSESGDGFLVVDSVDPQATE